MTVASLALVCPGCIQGAGGNLETGLLLGLIFMMVAPFFVIGVIGGGLMRAKRRELTDEVERFLDSERQAGAVSESSHSET
jgi:predicted lipid-binding transport protein (Tim44 family)